MYSPIFNLIIMWTFIKYLSTFEGYYIKKEKTEDKVTVSTKTQ